MALPIGRKNSNQKRREIPRRFMRDAKGVHRSIQDDYAWWWAMGPGRISAAGTFQAWRENQWFRWYREQS